MNECLEVSRRITFAITPKFSWRCKLVMRACMYWENHWILSSTRRGVYWKRFIVFFHSQTNRIIKVIWADQAECGLQNTKIRILLTNTQNVTLFWNRTLRLCMSRREVCKPLICYETSGTDYLVTKFRIANNGSTTHTAAKIYNLSNFLPS